MSVVRFKAWLEAMRGDVITNAHAIRVGNNIYPLTSANPDPNLTNDQKALIILNHMRAVTRAYVKDGAAAIEAAKQPQANIDAIKAAMDAAAVDI